MFQGKKFSQRTKRSLVEAQKMACDEKRHQTVFVLLSFRPGNPLEIPYVVCERCFGSATPWLSLAASSLAPPVPLVLARRADRNTIVSSPL